MCITVASVTWKFPNYIPPENKETKKEKKKMKNFP
jgi:hypothetical protein